MHYLRIQNGQRIVEHPMSCKAKDDECVVTFLANTTASIVMKDCRIPVDEKLVGFAK